MQELPRRDQHPYHRALVTRPSDGHPTLIVAGQSPRDATLYVSGVNMFAVRLSPRVVGWLRDVLAELPAERRAM